MKKRMTALLLAVVLFSASVIGNYDRAQASGIVIGGTVGVAEFILSLLASAGITYITVDTLTQGWGANSKKAYEEIASQLEQAYEGRRLEVIEGGGGGSEQPPKWDKFMDAAITAKAVEYTPGIWDCVKHAINQVMKTRYDVANQSTSNYYYDGSVFFTTSDGSKRYEFLKVYRGYDFRPDDYIVPEYPAARAKAKQYFLDAVANHTVLFSLVSNNGKSFYCGKEAVNTLCLSFNRVSTSEMALQLFISYSTSLRGYFIASAGGDGILSSGYSDLTVIKDYWKPSSSVVPKTYEIIIPPYINFQFGDGFYFVSAGGSRDVSIEPDSIVPGSSEPWKEEGDLTLPSSPPSVPVNFPTADQIQALIDALNQANNNNPENEDEKREEQATVVDDFVNDLVKPDPGTDPEPDTKPDPGTAPEPDTKPDPGTDPEPDTKPDPGTDPEPDTKPDPGTDPKPDTKPDTELEPSELEVDLTTIFPFCIPFDLMKLLAVLDAEPETPVFDLKLPYLNADGQIVDNIYTIDFSSFDELMQIVRMGELLVFLIGLAIITSKVIRW